MNNLNPTQCADNEYFEKKNSFPTARNLRHKLMYFKTYMHRTITYVGLISSAMVLFLFLSKLKEVGIVSFDIDKYFIPILLLGVLILFIIGWIDVKLFKGLQEEAEINFHLTPSFVELKNKVNDIWEHRK